MILLIEYFETGRYKIPGAKSTPNGADRRDYILESLEAFEKEILIDGLGYSLYKEVLLALDDLENASQTLKDLIQGKDYTINGLQVHWEGLLGKESLLVPYAYSQFLIRNQDTLTTFGTQQPEAINSSEVSAHPRYAEYYNEFFMKYQGECNNTPKVIYRSAGVGIDWYGSRNTVKSLYEFLQDNESDYPNAVFKQKEMTNSWGI